MSSEDLLIEINRLKDELVKSRNSEIFYKTCFEDSKNVINAIYNSIEEVFYFINPDFKIIEFNNASKDSINEFFGHEIKVGDNMLDFVLPEHKSRFEAVFKDCLKGISCENESEHNFDDGTKKWFRSIFKPAVDNNNKIIGITLTATETTKSKEIEKNLKVSLVNYRNLVETIPAIIFRSDLNNLLDLFYVNPQVVEMLGFELSEILHNPDFIKDILPIEDFKKVQNSVLSVLDLKHSIIEKISLNDKLGKLRTFYSNIIFLIDEDNNPTAFQGVLFDITEISDVKAEIENQSLFLQSLLDSIPDLVFYKDSESRYLGSNKAFIDAAGLSSNEELIGKSDIHLMKDSERSKNYIKIDQKVIKSGKARTYEDRFYLPDGRINDFETIKSPYYDKNGHVLGIIGISRNISDRNIFKAQIRDSEEKFRKIFEQMYDGVIITNNVGIIVGWNHSAENITGLKKEDIIGKYAYELNLSVFNIFNSKQTIKNIYDNQLLDFFRYGVADWLNKPNIDRLERKDGTIVYIQNVAFPIQTSKGMILGIILRDITENKAMEKEIIVAKNKAEEANRIKSIILSNLGHELRTPLNSIIGFSEILVEELKDLERAEIANYIYNAGITLRDTLNSLLALGDLESESTNLNLQITNLGDISKNVVSTFYEFAESKNLKFSFDQPDEDVLVNADYYFLQQSLSNIIENALKFTDFGSVEVSVIKFIYDKFVNQTNFQTYKSKLKLLQKIQELGLNNCAIVKVSDTGKGIKENLIDTVFEAFRQVSEGASRIYDGVGIGLTVARRMIELMNGKILVESTENVGSTFYVILPLCGFN